MKLNLGCGSDLQEGYLNIDLVRPQKSKAGKPISEFEFVIDDVQVLSSVEDDSCDEIKANDIIDHVYYQDLRTTLKIWIDKLKSDGLLKLQNVPDFSIRYQDYLENPSYDSWLKVNEYTDRLSYKVENLRSKNIVDYALIKLLLTELGMTEIEHSFDGDELTILYKKSKIKSL